MRQVFLNRRGENPPKSRETTLSMVPYRPGSRPTGGHEVSQEGHLHRQIFARFYETKQTLHFQRERREKVENTKTEIIASRKHDITNILKFKQYHGTQWKPPRNRLRIASYCLQALVKSNAAALRTLQQSRSHAGVGGGRPCAETSMPCKNRKQGVCFYRSSCQLDQHVVEHGRGHRSAMQGLENTLAAGLQDSSLLI